MALSTLNQRRWRNFKANKRAYWSLIIFSILYILSLGAELIANDRPLLISYRGEYYTPFLSFHSEREFGGDFQTEAIYNDPAVQCLIVTGGSQDCWDTPEDLIAAVKAGTSDIPKDEQGWMVWPLIPFHYSTINNVGIAPSAPDATHWLGTDDTARDVLARVIYGFRISILFTLIVTVVASVVGITRARSRAISAGARTSYSSGCWRSGPRRPASMSSSSCSRSWDAASGCWF
jgi:microcin C transport system permease protein